MLMPSAYIGKNDQVIVQLEALAGQMDGPDSQDDHCSRDHGEHGHPYG